MIVVMKPLFWDKVLCSFLFVLLTTHAMAQTETHGSDENVSFIDNYHQTISKEVVDWSEKIDKTLMNWLGGEEENETSEEAKTPLEAERKSSDAFFQTQKYLNETSITYIRIRFDTAVKSLDSDELNVNVRVHLPLSRTKKRLRLYLEDFNEDNAENLVKKTEDDTEDVSPKFGINYFAPSAWGIHSKYSLGFSGLHPYVRARYNTVFEPGEWVIEPVQTFQYSEKYHFSEKTNLYFDTEPWDNTLFRIQLNRGTRAHKDGMAYGLDLGFHWGLTGHTGMRVIQAFSGHTDYEYTSEDSDETKKFSGIYNYTTAFGYRRSIWRKWLYVEMIPAVNFHKEHNFHPNYSFRIFFDLFFGNYR